MVPLIPKRNLSTKSVANHLGLFYYVSVPVPPYSNFLLIILDNSFVFLLFLCTEGEIVEVQATLGSVLGYLLCRPRGNRVVA